MHEMSVVQTLIEQVASEVQRAGKTGRVTCLELAIGTLSGVHVDSIRFAFELMAPGTMVQDADLVISQPAAHLDCHQCGVTSEIPELIMVCPLCESADVTIHGGTELMLVSIDLEES